MSNSSLIFFLGVLGFVYWKLHTFKVNERKKKVYCDEFNIICQSVGQFVVFCTMIWCAYILIERAANNPVQQQEMEAITEVGKDYH